MKDTGQEGEEKKIFQVANPLNALMWCHHCFLMGNVDSKWNVNDKSLNNVDVVFTVY